MCFFNGIIIGTIPKGHSLLPTGCFKLTRFTVLIINILSGEIP